ncbi:MAG: EF-P lysine aminoacylase EpmA [Desulfobulbales bacterium]|nr:EF-P lysine aminoacylase EpmA [Desulfobulbales bacterium]
MISGLRLRQRAAVFRAVRLFFEERDYLEADTPLLLPVLAPERWIEPFTAGDLFLQTSPELCMKRLLAAGHARLYQICPCFRKGERGGRHLPEFSMLEWYRAGIDYLALMDECEELVKSVALECSARKLFAKPAGCFRLDIPFERLTVAEAFGKYARCDENAALAAGCYEEVMVEEVEPHLGKGGRPTFLYDYPAGLASLARRKSEEPALAERFELYADGIELANGFSELTDPVEQRCRFEEERRLILSTGREPGPIPERFLAALHDMPEAAGIALGLDRLVMLMTGAATIDEVVCFVPEEL